MLGGHREELRDRIHKAGAAVFKDDSDHDLLLKDEVLDRFSLGELPEQRVKNNHLSLLAMVDCWWKMGIVPYDHMICSTPVSCLEADVSLLKSDIPIAVPNVARHYRVPLPQTRSS